MIRKGVESWEEVFAQCVGKSATVNEDMLKKASALAGCDAVESAQILLEGPLAGVRRVHRSWEKVLCGDVPQAAQTYDKVMGLLEPYMCFLMERKSTVFAFHNYLVPERLEVAVEHIWKVTDATWSAVAPMDAGVEFYTKRGVVGYAYGHTLLWWYAHQDADFCAVMDTLHRTAKQGMRFGRMARSGLRQILSFSAHKTPEGEEAR